MIENKQRPVVLCILDGWGINEEEDNKHSAIFNAKPSFFNGLWEKYPHSKLEASGLAVGLPDGQMGNSEVGHASVGAGRVIFQDLPRISKVALDGKMRKNSVLKTCVKKTKKSKGDVHLLGLLSDGGVHSHIDHIIDIAKVVAKEKLNVFMHCFLDGRDAPQKSAVDYLTKFIAETEKFSNIKIASISGRYYAMDRDNRWERVAKAYKIITEGEDGEFLVDPLKIVEESYLNNVTDEFIEPIAVNNYRGMKDGDSFIFCNFRADRARELSKEMAFANFTEFERKKVIKFSCRAQLTEYSKEHNAFLETMFPPETVKDSLGEVLSKNRLSQLRIAETEKYAHVTFFFNCGIEKPYENEDRILVKSPTVATYDLQPEMSAKEINAKLIEAINGGKYNFIAVNFANADMVGHTGSMEATIKAIKTLDAELEKLVAAVLAANGTILITADHGNAEKMFDAAKNQPHTAHTTNKVPFILAANDVGKITLADGSLTDIAPTVLKILNIKVPRAMSGKSLIK
ncbi:MAG: 2,3-bisphosphoglycerate-independent phosphoglycerate mutase [Rickettsiales bacterium]|jgi:2,3-bisphosphoglycerate-independent phosphoglycerate mutase|nr:2,3-bisphosphoglycerate-independent phosphoglycerate mutase [Rickettsiales bacterium]